MKTRDERWTNRRPERAEILERRLGDAIYEAELRLQQTAEKALQRLDHTRERVRKKLQNLEKHAVRASAPVALRIEQRVAELRTDFAEREKTLEAVFEIKKQGPRPSPRH